MGNVSCVGPDGNRMIQRRLKLLARESHFDEEEIEALFEKFNALRVHPSQKLDAKIVSVSPISCRSILVAPELGCNLFLQAILSKFFSSPYRDFLLGRDNRVQISTVSVELPPGPLGLHVRAGLGGRGLYIADASESLAYKQVGAWMGGWGGALLGGIFLPGCLPFAVRNCPCTEVVPFSLHALGRTNTNTVAPGRFVRLIYFVRWSSRTLLPLPAAAGFCRCLLLLLPVPTPGRRFAQACSSLVWTP
jgi:hypothetical protein